MHIIMYIDIKHTCIELSSCGDVSFIDLVHGVHGEEELTAVELRQVHLVAAAVAGHLSQLVHQARQMHPDPIAHDADAVLRST